MHVHELRQQFHFLSQIFMEGRCLHKCQEFLLFFNVTHVTCTISVWCSFTYFGVAYHQILNFHVHLESNDVLII